MAASSDFEAEKLRYSRELAAYTLRQFATYSAHLSPDKVAAAKVPPNVSQSIFQAFPTRFSEPQTKPSASSLVA
ncbi:hypothetical protein ARMSODRAFT_1015125 [Armillaria solidipes]|uniref:Uncharacterized protein n=1 Tax=Armillaria solidipes TaxID=1076256 RepID=A0A2H3CBQ5_9AGAR|nr:hypothetical protein ARMSODRAFT_1015125 [Armillaria solidipes]